MLLCRYDQARFKVARGPWHRVKRGAPSPRFALLPSPLVFSQEFPYAIILQRRYLHGQMA